MADTHAAPGKRGKLYIVGFGPGAKEHMTYRAREAIAEAEVVVGYDTYINLVADLLEGKEVIRTGMQEEMARASTTVDMAEQGKTVAIVSSGDSGIYGMAGLVWEVLQQRGWSPERGIEIEVVPGVTAINACAALLGAPLVHDFAAISLSTLLTPWPVIARRIEAAAAADFVIGLYNPKSGRRTQEIIETQKIVRAYRAGATPVGVIKSAYRAGQRIVLTDLDHMLDHEIGMLTTLVIGNSNTFTFEGKMVTPRGYTAKYTWDGRLKNPQAAPGAAPEEAPARPA